MARTRAVREKDLIDKILDAVEVKGLNREEVLGQGGLLKQLTGRLLNKILEAEMERTFGPKHLGYGKNSNTGDNSGDSRNGLYARWRGRRHQSAEGSERDVRAANNTQV